MTTSSYSWKPTTYSVSGFDEPFNNRWWLRPSLLVGMIRFNSFFINLWLVQKVDACGGTHYNRICSSKTQKQPLPSSTWTSDDCSICSTKGRPLFCINRSSKHNFWWIEKIHTWVRSENHSWLPFVHLDSVLCSLRRTIFFTVVEFLRGTYSARTRDG